MYHDIYRRVLKPLFDDSLNILIVAKTLRVYHSIDVVSCPALLLSCGRGLSSVVGFVFKFRSEVTVASEAVLVKQIKSVV